MKRVNFVTENIEHFLQFRPELKRLPFSELYICFGDSDTSCYYLLGKVHTRFDWFDNPKRKFLRLLLQEESCADVLLNVLLIGDIGEQSLNVAQGDMLAVSGFKIELNTKSCNSGQPLSMYQVSVCDSLPHATVWIEARQRSLLPAATSSVNTLPSSQGDSEIPDHFVSAVSSLADVLDSASSQNTEFTICPEFHSTPCSPHQHVVPIASCSTSDCNMGTTRASVRPVDSSITETMGGGRLKTVASELELPIQCPVALPVGNSNGISSACVGTASSSSKTSSPSKGKTTSTQSTAITSSATTSAACGASERNPVISSPNKKKSPAVPGGNKAGLSGTSAVVIPGRRKQPEQCYTYDIINDIVIGKTVNVFGVVKFVKPIYRTRGKDYSQMLSIVDPSLTCPRDKLKCLLFAREHSQLPEAQIGDIIRFHRLRIVSYNGERQGQSGPGFSWLLFRNSAVVRSASSIDYTLTDDDRQKVRDLIHWSTSDNSLLSQDVSSVVSVPNSDTTISAVEVGMYFNLTCQVVATCVIVPCESMLLRVWDGTRISIPAYEQDMTLNECASRLVYDEQLHRTASGYIIDLWIYDDHFYPAKIVKPGDFVRLVNVHAMPHKFTDADRVDRSITLVELCLHGGGSKYHRSLTVLDPADREAQRLKLVLDECISNGGSEEDNSLLAVGVQTVNLPCLENSGAGGEASTSAAVVAASDRSLLMDESPGLDITADNENDVTLIGTRKRSSPSTPRIDGKKTRPNTDALESIVPIDADDAGGRNGNGSGSLPTEGQEATEQTASLDSVEDRCLLQTVTVITDHHHVKQTPIRDVLAHVPPYKFRVSANVVDYSPKPVRVTDMMQLVCERCEFLSPVPAADDEDKDADSASVELGVHHEEDGVRFYCCPMCNPQTDATDSLQPPDVVLLSYIILLQFILKDETGWLSAGLYRNEAVKFFNDTDPISLLKSDRKFQAIRQQLDDMCVRRRRQVDAAENEITSDDLELESEPPGRTSQRMECCLMSYRTPCGRAYQIFDTILSLT